MPHPDPEEVWRKRAALPESEPVKVTRIGNLRRACLWYVPGKGWGSCNPCSPEHHHTGGNP